MLKKNPYLLLVVIMLLNLMNCEIDPIRINTSSQIKDNVGFSVTGNPPEFVWPEVEGATYWLLVGTDPDFDNGSGTILIDESDLIENKYKAPDEFVSGKYHWKVKYKIGNFEDWYWSSIMNFTICSNGDYEVTGNPPHFEWPEVEGATYWLLVGTDPDFDNGGGTILINESDLTDNEYTASDKFTDGKYYWKVKFKVGDFEDWYWSPIMEFTIGGYCVSGNPPVFEWPEDPDILSYWILVCTKEDFDNGGGMMVIDESELTDNHYTDLCMLNPGTYYWKVKYIYANMNDSYWSPIQEFTIQNEGYYVSDTDTAYPEFNWPAVKNATYWLLVSDIPDIGSGTWLINEEDLTSNVYKSKIPFSQGTYYFKVKIKEGDASTWYWKPIMQFIVSN